VLTPDIYYFSGNPVQAIDAKSLQGIERTVQETYQAYYKLIRELWTCKVDGTVCLSKAGNRLYAGGENVVTAIDLLQGGRKCKPSWTIKLEGTASRILAADDRLFVVTLEGRIYAFGGEKSDPVRYPRTLAVAAGSDRVTDQAEAILERTGIRDGYCLVYGLNDGRLLEALATNSDLCVIAVDSDAAKVKSLRHRYDATGLYGKRIALLAGDPFSMQFPPYLSSLTVSEDLTAAGFNKGRTFAEKIFYSLRPYGGVACLPVPGGKKQEFAASVKAASLPNAEVKRAGNFTLLKRVGALPRSADWTHQYADAANTVVSKDKLVELPLGLLWFGGSSHEEILPRHGSGPSPQVVGGRLFIEGPDSIRAIDVYTGRVLWDAPLPGLGNAFNHRDKRPGANAIGSNYVSVHDGVYVAYGKTCIRLDPATGKRMREYMLPAAPGTRGTPAWSHISIWEDFLVAGASPARYEMDLYFTSLDVRMLKRKRIEKIMTGIRELRGAVVIEKSETEEDVDFVVNNLNKLMDDKQLAAKLPIKVEIESGGGKKFNRRLLEKYFSLDKENRGYPRDIGARGIWSGTGSKRLAAMNRHTGKILWTSEAENYFQHNGIAVGTGKVFCIDRLPRKVVEFMKRRGEAPKVVPKLIAFDIRTGHVVWSTASNVFGTWLGYSEKHDVLLQAGRRSENTLPDEPNGGMITYSGKDGEVLWSNMGYGYYGPCMIHGDTIITHAAAYSLLTGAEKTRKDPLTGTEVMWGYSSAGGGCDTAVASENLITFRSAAAGYFDLRNNSGTGNLSGFRSGCTANLIPANGVLNAPDYTRNCSCSYQNQTSLALVYMPDVEMWTFNKLDLPEAPLQRIGINFGAPGDRHADNGTLWLEYPIVGGPSPEIPVSIEPEVPVCFRHHSSRIKGNGLEWVAASGCKGVKSVTVSLNNTENSLEERFYTVRLHFVEPDEAEPGQRVFNVAIQGQKVLRDFDIAKEAGGVNRAIVKKFTRIKGKESLTLALTPAKSANVREPVICGIELVAE